MSLCAETGPNCLRILVVEDNADDRRLYRRLLEKDSRAFVLDEAESLNEAFALLDTEAHDCILLDYLLPDGDGLDFLRACREKQHAAAVVMLSGQGCSDIAVRAMKMGAADYMRKDNLPHDSFGSAIAAAVAHGQHHHEAAQRHKTLEESCRALSDFAHTVSHDIKAPLRHIAAYCDLLMEEYGRMLDDEGRRYTARLGVSARRLQRLVEKLLGYADASSGAHEEKIDVDMQALTVEVIEDLDEQIRAEHAQITFGDLPIIKGYPSRLCQLLQNLVSNALKYRGARVLFIEIGGEDRGDHWEFHLRDNGSGIEKQYHDTIFEAFKRLHSKDAVEGTGLGLSICRKVVELHGGRIWVESKPGQGATFYFTFSKI